jgi:pectin methylesterase-like acyl-CoA thioesterase
MDAVKLAKWLGLCVAVTLTAASAVRADWTYPYSDDFATHQAETDSYRHSAFWPAENVPLHEPYLSYITVDKNQGIAFFDYKEQLAELAYQFPIGGLTAGRSVKGVLSVDVSYPVTEQFDQYWPGKLLYQSSPDGMGWTEAVELPAGHHEFPISSAGGVCYVLFTGTRAVIDNLTVSLNSKPVTMVVPNDFPTIQKAIDAAGDGDVIEVLPGTYRGDGNRDIRFYGRAITLRSANNNPQTTIIDCEGGHRAFYFHEGEGADTEVSGFTIRGGQIPGSTVPTDTSHWTPGAAYPIGGGIYCEFSSPTIDNCIISGCSTELGGGLGAVGAEPIITNCTIEQCSASGRGAGIGLIGLSNATITRCIIRENAGAAGSLGGGLYVWQSAAAVTGCTFSDNSARTGGGAYCGASGTDVTFKNCIFSQNQAEAGAALLAEQQCRVNVVNCTAAGNKYTSFSSAAVYTSGADILINGSILYSNLYNSSAGQALMIVSPVSKLPVTYSDVEGGYTGPGNIKVDPKFADPDGEDYHLKSLYGRYDPQARRWFRDAEHSPCIDAGDPAASVADEPVPNGGRVNMGAYGGTREASYGTDHAIFYVDVTGRLDGAFTSIQKAIDATRDGDTVLVLPGVYREPLSFKGKAITVQSAGDAAVLTWPDDYAVSFHGGETPRSVLANFVITGCGRAAVLCDCASPTLKNLTIVDNYMGVEAWTGADPNIIDCILWYNSSDDLWSCDARYSDVQDVTNADTKAGNIKAEPKFADRERGDYHLKSRVGRYVPALDTWVQDAETSPCIDAGDPKEEPRGERVPNGGYINMGAYGGTPFASLSPRG